MRVIIFILLLVNLAACTYLKPRHHGALVDKRTPVANSNLIVEQEQSIKNQQVNSVINEYKFNENFDDEPLESISLNQIAPNYMEPTDVDSQVGLNEDLNVHQSNAKEVKLHEVRHHKHKKKSYPELSNIPKRKTSADEQKNLINNKKQELKKIEQKSQETTKTNNKPVKQSKKEVVSATRPNKAEIEAKLKQLQSNAASNNVVAKDKLVPKPAETKVGGAAVPTNSKSLPKIDLPSTPIQPSPKPSIGTAPAISSPNTVITPEVKMDPKTVAPSVPTLPNAASSPSVPSAVPVDIPSAPTAMVSPPSNTVPPVMPADTPKPQMPDNPMSKTVKVNKDQSVEVYDSGSVPPPLPPMTPPKQ